MSLRIRQTIEETLANPGEQISRWARLLRTQLALWQFCAKRLRENNLAAMSAALSFRTIFAMIPTLILAFLFLKSMGVVDDGKRALHDLLETSGLTQIVAAKDAPPEIAPSEEATSEGPLLDAASSDDQSATQPTEAQPTELFSLADQIEELVLDVESKLTLRRIGPVGALLMIWTALTLLTTIESSLNRIFEAPASRAFMRRVLLFWSALTLGPVLVVAAIYYSRIGIEAAAGLPGVSWLANAVGWLAPALVGTFVVAMGYRLIPNTHVRFASAFGGALVAVPAWMLARWAFAIYVDRFVLRGNLYGVLGVVPLFLFWLNISWSIFLFGAQLAHAATNLTSWRMAQRAERLVMGPSDWLAVAVAVARPFGRGEGLTEFDQIVSLTQLPGESVRPVLDRLVESGLIVGTEDPDERFGLSRPADKIAVLEVLDLADPRAAGEAPETNGELQVGIRDLQRRSRDSLGGATLADLCEAADEPAVENRQ